MNIQNWPHDRILQLPLGSYGRKFPVAVAALSAAADYYYGISQLALPEKCILWELFVATETRDVSTTQIRLALGDQLPTTNAQFMALEPFLYGFGFPGPDPKQFYVAGSTPVVLRQMKLPIMTAGRKLVMEIYASAGDLPVMAVAVVSSLPTEAPDWLVSSR